MRFWTSMVLLLWLVGGPAAAEESARPEIPKPAPRVAAGAWAFKGNDHPRLYGSSAFLKQLAQAKPAAFSELLPMNNLVANGVVYSVNGGNKDRAQQHFATAMRYVAEGPSNRHQDTWIMLEQVALTYDFYHDQISPADRRKMVDWFNGHLGVFTTDENAFHNSTLSKILTYLRIAYATAGENPRAGEFRNYAIQKLYEGKVLPVLNSFGAGGGFTECGWYTRGSLWHLVQALELARRVEKYDGFAKAPRFFYQRLAYEILQPYPGLGEQYKSQRFAVEGDGANTYGGHVEYPRFTRMVLSQYFRGSDLARFNANQDIRGTSPQARLEDFLWEEPLDSPLPIKDFPMAHIATGIGRVYARGDWSDEATWLRFECGPYFTQHQHLEVGNFEIFRHEPLATESGEYIDWTSPHALNWLVRSVAHNCILVDMPGEKWANLRDGGGGNYANDGGQSNLRWNGQVADNVQQWMSRRDQFERGQIVAYDNQPGYLFLAADCSKAYNPAKLQGWLRQIVFLRPHTFVIYDRVVTTNAKFGKAWVLHCTNEPEIREQTVGIQSGKGKLYVQSLLPDKASIRSVHGYTYGGQSFNVPDNPLTPLAHKWRMEIIPQEAKADEVFLTVLSTEENPNATLAKAGTGVGVKIGETEVRFTGNVGAALTQGGKTVQLKPGVKTNKWQ